MQKTAARPTSIDALPVGLSVEDVAAVLGISKPHAYALVNSRGFPRLTVGKRIIVPKFAFVEWMQKNTVVQ